MDKNRVIIFDTTLRDGEQSPGASMNIGEKIQIAIQLEKLGVNVIEAGFAAASVGDFNAIDAISKEVNHITVTSLARAVEKDIKAAADALKSARNKRIHTFIATSPIHMEYKLKMSPNEVITRAVNAVLLAKSYVDDIEFSCEDAGRSDISFLKEIIDAAINAGATTINLPDTVGYRLPKELYAMFKELCDFVGDRAIISAHNHDDLGLSTANSLACIEAGARQVECTINGIGERAGNAALEEIVMAIKTRKDLFKGLYTDINHKEIYPTSRLVSSIIGMEPQANKAIVGKNAFAHESGIHQDGMLKNPETYEIIRPSDVGMETTELVLGKHSGRHAFKDKLTSLGFDLNEDEINEAFVKFKALCDKKKEIFDEDIIEIINSGVAKVPEVYTLVKLSSSSSTNGHFTASITINHAGEEISDSALGNGGLDAIFKAIDRISGIKGELKEFQAKAVSQGKDALAKVIVKVKFEGKETLIGQGLDVDTMYATAKAYMSALNKYINF